MISILLVADETLHIEASVRRRPELELLRARDGEEAVEKLGRNRRIDAVILFRGAANAEVVRAILEENPASPPLFAPAPPVPPPGARALPPGNLDELIERVLRWIQAEEEPSEP